MMAVRITAAALLAGALIAAAPAAHRQRKAPPLSYLRYNSYSVGEFLRQLNDSAKLRQRYANHFHIAPEAVIPYFRANLVESYVPHTKRYPVWMSRSDGTKFVHYQTFRAGTRVLSLRNGQPVLKWACGNPLSNKLPVIRKKVVAQRTKKVLPSVQRRTRYVDVETPFETPRPEFPVVRPLYSAPPSRLWLASRVVMVPLRAARFPWALFPLVGIPGGHSHPQPLKNTEVPEPATAALLLCGAGAVAATMRLRRR